MAYDRLFFQAYENYLDEVGVRQTHDEMLNLFRVLYGRRKLRGSPTKVVQASKGPDPHRAPAVVDLGCGQSHEYQKYGSYSDYLGIDRDHGESSDSFMTMDYRDERAWNSRVFQQETLDEWSARVSPDFMTDIDIAVMQAHRIKQADVFVSLFSTEITAPHRKNQRLYEVLFANLPEMRFGLVSGFYYWNKRHLNPVKEAGDVVSFQTLDPPEAMASEWYSEQRFTVACPSKMFGPDVYEVWRVLERRRR